jgi:Tol biopolymer transport system component
MTEQKFDDPTDVRIGALIRAFGDEAVRPFEPHRVVQGAVEASGAAPWWFRALTRRRLEGHRGVGLAALLLLAALALVAGVLLLGAGAVHRPPIAEVVRGAACDVLDPLAARAGAADGGGWLGSTPTPGPRSLARPGLLAGWANYSPAGSETLDLDLVLFDPSTGTETRLTHFDRAFSSQSGQVEWSPDGSAVAIRFDDHHQCTNLYVVAADGSRLVRPVQDTQEESDDWFAWAPDGSALATIHGRARVPAVAPLETRQLDQPTWIWSLRLVPRDGSPALELGGPCDQCGLVNTPIWSPDGGLIASTFERPASGSGATVTRAGVAITAPDRIGWTILYEEPASESGYLTPIGWLDARTIFATRPKAAGNGTELMTLSADRPGDPTPTGVVLPSDPIALSPDGRFVVDIAGAWSADGTPQHEEVDVVDVITGGSRTVWTSGTAIGVEEAAWSPDSRALVLSAVSYTGGDKARAGVWVVNIDGTGLRRVRSAPMGVAWQPVWP